MRCPSCGFVSFEKDPVCKKCGAELPVGENTEESIEASISQEMPEPTVDGTDASMSQSEELKEPTVAESGPATVEDSDASMSQSVESPSIDEPTPEAIPVIEEPPAPEDVPPARPAEAKERPKQAAMSFSQPEEIVEEEQAAAPEPEPQAAVRPRAPALESEVTYDSDEFSDSSSVYLDETPEKTSELVAVARGRFARRASALLVDAAILAFCGGCFLAVAIVTSLGITNDPDITRGDVIFALLTPLFIIMVISSVFYFTLFYSLTGQTPGKRAFRLVVVERDGGRVRAPQAFLRSVGYFFSALPLGLGFLWALWDKKQLPWHDKLAGTRVIEIR